MAVLLSGDSLSTRALTRPWLWFNLCSLDAPLVAVVWQLWFARCFGIALAPLSTIALALTVWMIYAMDRLLDVARPAPPPATRRHRFHREHARGISIAVFVCFLFLAIAATRLRPALLRDGLLLSGIVALYFLAVHALPGVFSGLCSKEIAVGVLFALGTALAPWLRLQHSQAFIAPLLLFTLLCCLNCAAIEVWEWRQLGGSCSRSPQRVTLWLAKNMRPLSALTAVAALLLLVLTRTQSVFAAIVVSALSFLWLDVERERLPVDLLRVLADVPLLSPLLLLGFH